jgi:4-amino-4-deoxy-L-arabinose transferase-like glycosyltransferase
MVESGDWLVPRYRGQEFFDKPPLAYWLMATSQLWAGTTPGAARTVPAMAALLVLLATIALGALLFDRKSALWGGLVLATTFAFVTFGHVAMSDMLLALWSTLAVGLALRALRPPAPAFVVPALGAVLGLGFLTKGPIALVLPGLAMLALWWPRRRDRLPVTMGGLAGAAVLFAVFGLGWFFFVWRRLGTGPLEYFFLRENLQRFAGEAYDVGRPTWFYLPTYFAEGVPWSPFLPLALWRGRDDAEGRPGRRRLVAWILLALVPLSLSRGKIDYYLLPLYPALSLLVGRFFATASWGRLEAWWSRAVLAAAVALLALVARIPGRVAAGWLPSVGAQRLLVAVAIAAGLGCVLAALRPTPGRVAAALAGGGGAVAFVLVFFFLPAFWAGQPNRAIASIVQREQLWRPDATVALCADPSRAQRDVLFYTRLAVEERCDLWALAASRSPFLLLIRPEERESFRVIPGFREIARYSYLPASALTLDGLLRPPAPGEIVLAANHATKDPEADRRRRRVYKKMLYLEQFHPELPAAELAEKAESRRALDGQRP